MDSQKTLPAINRYEAHTYTMCEGWVNTWSISELIDDRARDRLDSYQTVNEVQTEIDDLIRRANLQDMDYSHDDYAIFDNEKGVYI